MGASKRAKVFLVGEGPTELGELAKEATWRSAPPKEGFVQPLLRRVVGDDCPLTFEGRKVALLGKQLITEPKDALGKKARFALALAGAEEARALVFLHDLDKTPGRRLSATEADRRRREIEEIIGEGFRVAREKNGALGAITTVMGIPERMIESWILGDPAALRAHGLDATEAESLSPETTWGDEQDPGSKHPKRVLERTSGRELHYGDYAEIAEHADPEAIATRCPKSFAPFCDAVRAAVEVCRGAPQSETKRRPKRRG